MVELKKLFEILWKAISSPRSVMFNPYQVKTWKLYEITGFVRVVKYPPLVQGPITSSRHWRKSWPIFLCNCDTFSEKGTDYHAEPWKEKVRRGGGFLLASLVSTCPAKCDMLCFGTSPASVHITHPVILQQCLLLSYTTCFWQPLLTTSSRPLKQMAVVHCCVSFFIFTGLGGCQRRR